jgi:hypothetical protein
VTGTGVLPPPAAACLVIDPDGDRLRLADDAEGGRLLDREAPVGLAFGTGQQRVEGAGTAAASLGASCTWPSVSATTAPSRERSVSARGVGQAREQRAALAARPFQLGLAQLDARRGAQPPADLLLGRGQLLRAAGEAPARRAVLHDQDDVVERLALLTDAGPVRQRRQEQAQEQRPPPDPRARRNAPQPIPTSASSRRHASTAHGRCGSKIRLSSVFMPPCYCPSRSSRAGTWTWSVL